MIRSVARRQPRGFYYPVLDFFAPQTDNGIPLLLRHFDDPVNGYKDAYYALMRLRYRLIQGWVNNIPAGTKIALCCWCNNTYGQGSRQVQEHGTFVCHTVLIGQIIKKIRPEVTIVLDPDREKYSAYRL